MAAVGANRMEVGHNSNPSRLSAAVGTDPAAWGRRLRLGLLLLGGLLLAGCTRKEQQGDLMVWKYETWVGFAAILGGIAVAAGAIALRKSGNWSWVIMLLAIGFTIGFAPFGFVDHVSLDQEHIATRWGFWFAPTLHDIRFDDVSRVDYTKETRRGRRGRKETSYYLVFTTKNGTQDKLTATNSLMEAAAEDLMLALAAKNLSVNDLTGE